MRRKLSQVNSVLIMYTWPTIISQFLGYFLLQVEGANSLVSELAKAASQELKLLDQSRDLLSTVAALHVTPTTLFFCPFAILTCIC